MKQPPVQGDAATQAYSLNGLLDFVRMAGGVSYLIGQRTHGPLRKLIRSAYVLFKEGETAIELVQREIAAGRPVEIAAPDVPDLPEWSQDDESNHSSSFVNDAWRVLRPVLTRLVEKLPGTTPGQTALKAWAVKCMDDLGPLAESIEALLTGSGPSGHEASAKPQPNGTPKPAPAKPQEPRARPQTTPAKSPAAPPRPQDASAKPKAVSVKPQT